MTNKIIIHNEKLESVGITLISIEELNNSTFDMRKLLLNENNLFISIGMSEPAKLLTCIDWLKKEVNLGGIILLDKINSLVVRREVLLNCFNQNLTGAIDIDGVINWLLTARASAFVSIKSSLCKQSDTVNEYAGQIHNDQQNLSFRSLDTIFEYQEHESLDYQVSVYSQEEINQFVNLGIQSFQTANYPEAIRYFDKAIAANHQLHELFLLKSVSLANMGKGVEALAAIMSLLNFDPNHENGRLLFNQLKHFAVY